MRDDKKPTLPSYSQLKTMLSALPDDTRAAQCSQNQTSPAQEKTQSSPVDFSSSTVSNNSNKALSIDKSSNHSETLLTDDWLSNLNPDDFDAFLSEPVSTSRPECQNNGEVSEGMIENTEISALFNKLEKNSPILQDEVFEHPRIGMQQSNVTNKNRFSVGNGSSQENVSMETQKIKQLEELIQIKSTMIKQQEIQINWLNFLLFYQANPHVIQSCLAMSQPNHNLNVQPENLCGTKNSSAQPTSAITATESGNFPQEANQLFINNMQFSNRQNTQASHEDREARKAKEAGCRNAHDTILKGGALGTLTEIKKSLKKRNCSDNYIKYYIDSFQKTYANNIENPQHMQSGIKKPDKMSNLTPNRTRSALQPSSEKTTGFTGLFFNPRQDISSSSISGTPHKRSPATSSSSYKKL